MNIVPLRDKDVAVELERASERRQLSLLYQPKIDLATGDLAGVEALMRWESPVFGTMEPGDFIPVAERCGAIDRLTEWGLREAIRHWLGWREQGFQINIAFNLSALTLRDVHFPDFLQRLCQIEGMPCEQLTLEITEGATQHTIRLLDTLTRFRIKSMGLALDDFGTGYSSLLQLRQLPFTELKIDRCFVGDVATDPEARLIVKSVIDLAHGLGLIATAEGVQTEAVFEVLAELGCDHAQGFLMARPMKPIELAPWLLKSQTHWRRQCSARNRAPEQAVA